MQPLMNENKPGRFCSPLKQKSPWNEEASWEISAHLVNLLENDEQQAIFNCNYYEHC